MPKPNPSSMPRRQSLYTSQDSQWCDGKGRCSRHYHVAHIISSGLKVTEGRVADSYSNPRQTRHISLRNVEVPETAILIFRWSGEVLASQEPVRELVRVTS